MATVTIEMFGETNADGGVEYGEDSNVQAEAMLRELREAEQAYKEAHSIAMALGDQDHVYNRPVPAFDRQVFWSIVFDRF